MLTVWSLMHLSPDSGSGVAEGLLAQKDPEFGPFFGKARTAGGDGVATGGDIVHPDQFGTLQRSGDRNPHGAKQTFVDFPSHQLLQETLAGMTNTERTSHKP